MIIAYFYDLFNRLVSISCCTIYIFMLYYLYKPRLEYFYWSVLFEKHQPFGDCTVNERFANTFSAILSCLHVNGYERI